MKDDSPGYKRGTIIKVISSAQCSHCRNSMELAAKHMYCSTEGCPYENVPLELIKGIARVTEDFGMVEVTFNDGGTNASSTEEATVQG